MWALTRTENEIPIVKILQGRPHSGRPLNGRTLLFRIYQATPKYLPLTGKQSVGLLLVYAYYAVAVFSEQHHDGRTKKRLSDIKKRLDSLETLMQQQIEQQNANMQRILDMLLLQQQQQQQQPTVDAAVTDDRSPTQRTTVTFDRDVTRPTQSHAQ